jgi:hypothetical protein
LRIARVRSNHRRCGYGSHETLPIRVILSERGPLGAARVEGPLSWAQTMRSQPQHCYTVYILGSITGTLYEKLHEQIDEAIRLHDKLLLILSEHSMNSEWVKTEIFNAREREVAEKKEEAVSRSARALRSPV